MKRWLLVLTILSVLVSGCITIEVTPEPEDTVLGFPEEEVGPVDPVVVEDMPEPEVVVVEPEKPKKKPGKGSQVLLWKPISESSKTCVILMPSRFRPSMITAVRINGSNDEVHPKTLKDWPKPDKFIWPNDDRPHIYLNKKGEDYGQAVELTFVINGKTIGGVIPDGAKRFEIRW